MGIWQKIWRSKGKESEDGGFNLFYPSLGGVVGKEQALRLSTVFACVDVLSNSVAQLPLEPYTIDSQGRRTKAYAHPTYGMLCYEPNDRMTRFTLIKSLVVSSLLEGNGFARIALGDDGVATAITYIPAGEIAIITKQDPTEGEVISGYYHARTSKLISPDEMIHILNFTQDGIRGESTITYAGRTLSISDSAERKAQDFFKSGGGLLGILTTEDGRLTETQRKEIQRVWLQTVNPPVGEPTGIAVLEAGLKYQSISIKPSDAQLLESRQFSIPEICRFFGVSPVKIHDLSKSSYSTVEATNTAFVVDSLSPLAEKIAQEIRRKIYPPKMRKNMIVAFDTSAIIKADTVATTNMMRSLVGVGVMTPNEARERIGLPPIEGGDKAYMQINMATIEDIQNGGKQGQQQQGQ